MAQRLDLAQAALTGEPVTLADGVVVDGLCAERRVGGGDRAGGVSNGRGHPAAADLGRPIGHGAGHGGRPG